MVVLTNYYQFCNFVSSKHAGTDLDATRVKCSRICAPHQERLPGSVGLGTRLQISCALQEDTGLSEASAVVNFSSSSITSCITVARQQTQRCVEQLAAASVAEDLCSHLAADSAAPCQRPPQ